MFTDFPIPEVAMATYWNAPLPCVNLWLSLGLNIVNIRNICDNVMAQLKKIQSKVLMCSDVLMQNLLILFFQGLGYTYRVGTSSIAHVLLFE